MLREQEKQSEQRAIRELELHQKEREVLFDNEALVIKVLQAVSGASMVAGIAQTERLISLAGRVPFLVFLTAMAVSLIASVLAAHWKHQYKMHDVKAALSPGKRQEIQAALSYRYLTGMRAAIWTALLVFGGGFGQLVLFFWVIGLKAV